MAGEFRLYLVPNKQNWRDFINAVMIFKIPRNASNFMRN